MKSRKILSRLLFISALLFSPLACWSASLFPDKYDSQIKTASETWLPGWPWKLWKAQLYQESRLNPAAKSSVGAAGLAQFMPKTWTTITREMRLGAVTRDMAGPSIQAGAFYMGKLRSQWSAPRPWLDRHDLAAASYNAGLGSILKSQKRCEGKPLYSDIVPCLHLVTGKKNAKQTLTYVRRIKKWWSIMN